MIDLIRTDLYKMGKSKLIKVILCIATISALSMLLVSHSITSGDHTLQRTGIASLLADSQIFTLLGCIIIGMFLCNDFDYKIIENAITSGHSRRLVVQSTAVTLIILVVILSIPYLVVTGIANMANLEISLYLPTAYLSIMQLATNGTNFFYILLSIISAILMYSAQLSIGILIMFYIKKPVIVVALTYIVLVVFGPILSLNETSKNIMAYTPFGIDFMKLQSTLQVSDLVAPIALSIGFIILIIEFSVFVFRKADIK